MSGYFGWAVLCGLGIGVGLCLVVARVPAWRSSTFVDRIAPHIRVGQRPSRLLVEGWTQHHNRLALVQFLDPLVEQIRRRIRTHNPGNQVLRKRLAAAGSQMSVIDFRTQQVLSMMAGIFLGAVVVTLAGFGRSLDLVPSVFLVATCGVVAYLFRGWILGEQVARRRRKILTQFPTVAEVMALAVGAGESTVGAIERISATCRGVIGEEFAAMINEIRAGSSVAKALNEMADRVQVSAITRFVDAVNVATERGTPIAQVLRDQAQDVRDAAKRELMEVAGKREISMLVPIVFGVLPLTVIFAVFPGLALLEVSY
ncbi:type II secretion system F family protein [Glutamicibacter sp. X7]